MQTVWLKLYDRIDTVRQPERLIGWLARVARNECINVLRARSRLVVSDDHEEPSENPDLTRALSNEQSSVVLAAAFRQLDQRCRELLTLCLADPPIGYDDIAAELDLPRGSIGPTRRRCLDKLRAMPSVSALGIAGGGV